MEKEKIEHPKISIITPTFNSEGTIRATIESVLQQDYNHWEHIIYDGQSTDNTVSIIKVYSHIKFVSEPDGGVYDAMNKGIKVATGDYLFFMGGDDVFYENSTLSQLAESCDGFDFVYGDVKFKKSGQIYSGESSFEKLIKSQVSICHQACFYHKSIFEKVGLYDTKYFVHADFDLNVKIFEDESITKKYIDKIICIFNEVGMSGNHSNADKFHDDLASHYISKYSSQLEVIWELARMSNENKKLKKDIYSLRQSKFHKLYARGIKLFNKFKADR